MQAVVRFSAQAPFAFYLLLDAGIPWKT